MDDPSAFKIADRRAAHTDDIEEKKPAEAPAAPPKPEPAAAKQSVPGPSSVEAEDQAPYAEQPDELSEEEEENVDEMPQPRGAGPAQRPRNGMRGPSLVSMHVVETAGFMMEMLFQKAFITMGLIPNPETGRRERDLEQTRIAIDLLTATAEQMRGRWGMPGVEQDLEAQLTSLRLQYARMAPQETGKA